MPWNDIWNILAIIGGTTCAGFLYMLIDEGIRHTKFNREKKQQYLYKLETNIKHHADLILALEMQISAQSGIIAHLEKRINHLELPDTIRKDPILISDTVSVWSYPEDVTKKKTRRKKNAK